jgi:hypothetical protein
VQNDHVLSNVVARLRESEGALMPNWIVRRWARYGHDRLYAETPRGTALGYMDLKTGRYHSDDLSNLPLLEKAIGDYLASRKLTVPPEVTVDTHDLVQWHDISETVAGAAARERALAERQAQGRLRHVLARMVGARTDERAWRIGADGEEAVGEQLAKLGPEWRVLHAVRVGERGSDIDHVVIGPAGVFTVNAKHHPQGSVWVGGDTFMVNGQRVPYIGNSRYEARRASRLLTERAGFPVGAVGVIAVMGAHRGFTVKKQPEDGMVVVVQRKRISQLLQKLPPRLNLHEIDVVFQIARRSTTWQ